MAVKKYKKPRSKNTAKNKSAGLPEGLRKRMVNNLGYDPFGGKPKNYFGAS